MDVGVAELVPLTRDLYATVSAADYTWLRADTWYANTDSRGRVYARRSRDGVYMHRLIVDAPAHLVVDHRDNDPLNNQRCNLRLTTSNRNTQWSLRCSSRSGYLGVQERRTRSGTKRYRVRLSDGKGNETSVGTFGCSVEAARAYDKAAVASHGAFAATNFPITDYTTDFDCGDRAPDQDIPFS